MDAACPSALLLFRRALTTLTPFPRAKRAHRGQGIPGVVMSQKWSALIGVFTIIFSAGLLLSLSSCGHDQELIAITIQPPTETFGAPNVPVSADTGLTVTLRAYGSYIHPPVTKEITNRVTW